MLRQRSEQAVLPVLRAALDLYPFDSDVALQALPYEEELEIQDRINFLALDEVDQGLFPMLLAQRDLHQDSTRVLAFLQEIGWEDPRLDSALALDFPDSQVPPRWTGEWRYDLLLYNRGLLTSLPQDYIAQMDVNQDQITDQWLIFQNDQLVYWLQDWDQDWVVTENKVSELLEGGDIDPQIDLALRWSAGELVSIIESLGDVRGILNFQPYPFVSSFEVQKGRRSLTLHFPPQKIAQRVLSDQPHLIPALFIPQYFDSKALVMDEKSLGSFRVRLEERLDGQLIRSDWVYRGQILQRLQDLSGRGFSIQGSIMNLGSPNTFIGTWMVMVFTRFRENISRDD
jgi:hypothetical protein